MTVSIDGIQINYIDVGDGADTVLFLHGWGAPIKLYTSVFDRLVKNGYRVLAFDMPGVGASEQPKNALTMADYRAITLGFLSHFGISNPILMGHSHGGRLSLDLLCDVPQGLTLDKAVLMGSAGNPAPKSTAAKIRSAFYRALRVLGTAKLTEPLFGERYRHTRDKRASDDYKAATPVMRATMNNVLPADYSDKMGNIKAEVLLIWGERDTATPLERGHDMQSRISGSGLAPIQNAGHFAFIDNPNQFFAVLDAFLPPLGSKEGE